MAGSERRENTRTQVLLKVQYHEPKDLLSDYLTDLAEGGLFIRTDVPFAIGQRISFFVSFPGLLDPMELHGIVRWRNVPPSRSGEIDADADAESSVGVGVEFVFESDATRQQIAALVQHFRVDPEVSSPRAEGVVDHGPFRVLLVEDNQFVHDLFKHAVKRFHREMPEMGALEISSAANGQEALQYIEKNSVDLAIVDHFLPVMSGSELVTRMRASATYRTIPILIVSVGGEGVREQALGSGADLYLDKPVLLKQLLTTLRMLVTKRRFVTPIAGSAPP